MSGQTWVLVANGSQAKVYDYISGEEFTLIEEFHHPESREKGRELASDRPGHAEGSGGGHGSYVSASDPKEYEIERFAQELSSYIEKGRKTSKCGSLILAAPPHVLGLLKNKLSSQTAGILTEHTDKDYTQLSESELKQRLGLH